MKCMSCGTEMNSTTGGNYTCPKCGQSVNDGVYRPPTSITYGKPYLGWGQMGWICPKCGKVLAPWRAECDCHKMTTTTEDLKEIKSEAVKEFAERLKNEIINDTAYACDSTQHSGYYDYQIKIGDIPEYIDNLVKEMIGDDNA